MEFLEIIKAIILGIVEGVTEWLPVSSTGHMILVDEFLKLNVSKEFMEMFLVVIQLGAILAVILLYWKKIFPFKFDNGVKVEKDTIIMWVKILIACVPAAIVGLLWDDYLNALFYNPTTVAIMLILFELIAAVFPGTSRSGATIVGALLIGVSRTVAAEFTFFLAIPVMLGASALKLVKFGLKTGFVMTGSELTILLVGMIVAFIVSILAIKFLMSYIKNNDFKVFGWYRIVLGILVLAYFYVIR